MGVPATMLRPPPYLGALVDYLRRAEPESWRWFSAARHEHAEALRMELLKQTYRLDPATHAEVFAAAQAAANALGITDPFFLYQSQSALAPNAALCHLPGEAHVIFSGPVLQLLTPPELRAVLGHELAHHKLWSESGADFLVADRLIQAAASALRVEPSHGETARLLRLYTEVYADRGAAAAVGEIGPVISSLVKTHTGLAQVDPESYQRQADEIFARTKVRTEEVTHPETFIRTRALKLWADGAAETDAEIVRMIEGPLSVERLDLLGQARLQELSRQWIDLLLQPAWFRSEPVLAQARLVFERFEPAATPPDEAAMVAALEDAEHSVRDYFCYLALDFVAADPELEQEPLRAALALTERFGWVSRFETIAAKELKLKKRDVQQLRPKAAEAIPADDASGAPAPAGEAPTGTDASPESEGESP